MQRRKGRQSRGKRFWHEVYGYSGILVGAALLALALDWFTVPNRIAAGGVSGLATITFHQFGWPVGITMLVVNIPLFVFGIRFLGFAFGLRSLVGAVATSLFVDLFAPFAGALTSDPFLASIYGGLLTGVGIGITFRFGGSTGGTDIAARLLHHLTHIGVGRSFMVFDGLVIAWAAFAFNSELALYALVSLFVASKTIDFLQEGRPFAKGAMIISDSVEEIAEAVLHELDRGATLFTGKGLYSGKDRPAILVVVGRHQIQHLTALIRRIDKHAFMVVTDVSDVLGEGFERR